LENERPGADRPGFDFSTASGKLMRTIMAGLGTNSSAISVGTASSQVWLLREPEASSQAVQRPSDKKTQEVLAQHKQGRSYRLIGRNLGLSKNTVMEIVERETD
jgi:hypothetical protein